MAVKYVAIFMVKIEKFTHIVEIFSFVSFGQHPTVEKLEKLKKMALFKRLLLTL